MNTTTNQQRFANYYDLANRIIEVTEKDTLAEVAKILAIHIAHYRAKFGTMSMEETVRLLHADTLTDEDVGTAADGMEHLVSVLARGRRSGPLNVR